MSLFKTFMLILLSFYIKFHIIFYIISFLFPPLSLDLYQISLYSTEMERLSVLLLAPFLTVRVCVSLSVCLNATIHVCITLLSVWYTLYEHTYQRHIASSISMCLNYSIYSKLLCPKFSIWLYSTLTFYLSSSFKLTNLSSPTQPLPKLVCLQLKMLFILIW